MNACYAIVIAGSASDMQVLVVKRLDPAYESKWAFPGGLMQGRSDPLGCCVEDLAKQTGLALHRGRAIPLSVRKRKDRDPRDEIIAHPFVFYLPEPMEIEVGEKVSEVRFLSLYVVKDLAWDLGAILCEAMGKFWRQMPSSHIDYRRVELPSLFVKKHLDYQKGEIIFFGGSFDPWHPGHMECLNICPSKNIIVVPDYNPWKETAPLEGRCFWTQFHNLCMILKDTPYGVYPGFWGLEDPNPTINWIPNIRAESKGLLLGDDSFCNILEWKDSRILITFLNIIYVIPRIHKKEEMEKIKRKVLEIHPNMIIEILPEHEFMQESSTLIREKQKI